MEANILSPSSMPYLESNVTLDFTVNRFAGWMGYSLDGKDNITLYGNTTLPQLSGGIHQLTVYANDTFGYTDKQAVTFFVATSTLALEVAVVVIVIVVVAVLLFRRHRKNPNLK